METVMQKKTSASAACFAHDASRGVSDQRTSTRDSPFGAAMAGFGESTWR
jgi:hypothetical protein